MGYDKITSKTSKQYKIIHSDKIKIGSDGLLYSGEFVGVALGSRYGDIGDKFIITLDTGKQFKAIKIDEKSDRHTTNGCHHKSDGSMVEFVIDTNKAKKSYSKAMKMGNFNYISKFKGIVVKIQKVKG